MTLENWKLWLVPFGVWGLMMAWYSGYQSGFKEGHDNAWQMSRPSNLVSTEVSATNLMDLNDNHLANR